MMTRSFSLIALALISFVCVSPLPAFAAQSTAELVATQPPPMTGDPDHFALDVNCSLYSADQTALDECSKDLDLIKGLGVGTVRLGISWDFLSSDSTLDPNKVAFTKALLNAARTRGMKILFQVGMLAPAGAYQCAGVQRPPTESSPRIDFCDAIFKKYLGALMDVVLPYTADIELFNELNWGFSPSDPKYGAPENMYGYIPRREAQLYLMTREVLDAKKQLGYKAVLHSQGISYFYNSAYPNDGWTPPSGSGLIQATDEIAANGNHRADPASPLNAALDVVDVHPYFSSSAYGEMMQSFIKSLATVTTNGPKKLWITETNNGIDGTDAGMTAAFNQVKILMDNGSVQKAFWYVVRNGDPGNGEGDGYSIYDYNRNLIRPQLAAAIKAYSESIPSSGRFLSAPYLTPIQ